MAVDRSKFDNIAFGKLLSAWWATRAVRVRTDQTFLSRTSIHSTVSTEAKDIGNALTWSLWDRCLGVFKDRPRSGGRGRRNRGWWNKTKEAGGCGARKGRLDSEKGREGATHEIWCLIFFLRVPIIFRRRSSLKHYNFFRNFFPTLVECSDKWRIVNWRNLGVILEIEPKYPPCH